jgi:hypothetical protein
MSFAWNLIQDEYFLRFSDFVREPYGWGAVSPFNSNARCTAFCLAPTLIQINVRFISTALLAASL